MDFFDLAPGEACRVNGTVLAFCTFANLFTKFTVAALGKFIGLHFCQSGVVSSPTVLLLGRSQP